MQWQEIRLSPKAAIVLPPWKTKTKEDRTIPISSRLRAILEMRRTDAAGEPHAPEAHVFGTTTGERILGFKRAWQTAVLQAHRHTAAYVKGANLSPASRATLRAIDLHFPELRREAGTRWLDARDAAPLSAAAAWLPGHKPDLDLPTGDGRGITRSDGRFDRQR